MNSNGQTLQHSYTTEFTKAVIIYKRPAQYQVSLILSMEGEGAHEIPLLAEGWQLMIAGKGNVCFLLVCGP